MLPDNIDLRSQLDHINGFLATLYKDIYRVSELLHKMNAKDARSHKPIQAKRFCDGGDLVHAGSSGD